MTKLTTSALTFSRLGDAVKAFVDTIVRLDGDKRVTSAEKKFSLLCGTVRFVVYTVEICPESTAVTKNTILSLQH